MKIAFVVTRSDAVGGAQIHVRDLSSALIAAGHEPVVLAGGDGPWFDQLAERRIPLVRLRHLARSIRPWRDVRAAFELRRRLRELAPDLVSTHTAKAGWLGRIVARSLDLPVLFTAHGWTFTDGIARVPAAVWRFAERLVGRLAQRIVTVSEFDRRLALEAGIAEAERVVTIRNGMPDVAQHLRADPAREPAHLVMVARFETQKDHRTLLLALSMLQDLPWRLTLVGGGPLLAAMQALSGELGLADRVTFAGARNDVDQILSQAQVFVLATLWEGLPRSILEAMRAGLPVVATDVAGIPEQVLPGVNGALVPPRDPAALAGALRHLVLLPAERVRQGLESRKRFEALFHFERMFDETLRTYRSLSERARTDPYTNRDTQVMR